MMGLTQNGHNVVYRLNDIHLVSTQVSTHEVFDSTHGIFQLLGEGKKRGYFEGPDTPAIQNRFKPFHWDP